MSLFPLRAISPTTYTRESVANEVQKPLPTYRLTDNPSLDRRAQGDAQLAQRLGPQPFDQPTSGPDSLVDIPPHSTLGIWMDQLDKALRHPGFKRWMALNNVSPSNVQFDPAKNTLTAIVGGQPKTFTLDDDSGFAAVAAPIIQAVRTLGFWPASSGRFLYYPHKPYNVASFQDVLKFYGVKETAPQTYDDLATDRAFAPIADTDALLGKAALARQQQVVGDSHDLHNLLDGLNQLMTKLPTPPIEPLVLARELSAFKMSIYPGSTYRQAHSGAEGLNVSVARFISASGAPVPKSLYGLKKLIASLRNDPLELARAKREKTRYKTLMRSTHEALPMVRAEAKKWAEAIILKLTGKQVDADTLYLNRFQGGGNTAATITGWEHMYQEPWRSQTLPDALLSNFSEDDWVPGNMDTYSGLYTVGVGQSEKGGYGARNQFPLLPSDLMHESWKTDFQAHINDKQERFWKDHGEDYRSVLKGEFVNQARQQLKAYERASPEAQHALPPEQQFTRDDFRLVMKAASNLPLDENEPMTVQQLQTKTLVKDVVRTHRFDINGRVSTDILRFRTADHQTQILYIPGHSPAFVRFKSVDDLDKWVADQAKHPDKRKALEKHFSLRDRQDNGVGFWSDFKSFITGDKQSNKGVDTSFEYLGNDYFSHEEGIVIDHENALVTTDIFSVIRDATRQRMTSDADVSIKSNSEVTRDTWLNDLTVAAGLLAQFALVGEPIVVGAAAAVTLTGVALGTEKTVSGDTQAERTQGVTYVVDGMLNTLFLLWGGTTASDPLDQMHPPSAPLPVLREVFADGIQAQVVEHSLSDTAYTLPRTDGYDLVDGERIYRYRGSKPDELRDLATKEAAPLDDFEAYCPAPAAGGRVRRGANDECFAKLITDLPKTDTQLQALEHVRLLPSKTGLLNKHRQVVYERRLHRMVETESGPQLHPVTDAERITYKTRVRGKIVNDEGFGLPAGATNLELAQQTRVVKLGKISDLSDDARQVRGVIVNQGAQQYLVIEADTAEFYYAPLGKAKTGDITFKKCSPSELNLVHGYRDFLKSSQGVKPLNAALIALPKLDEAYAQLEKSGALKNHVDQLKQLCKGLSKEQQREVLYQLQRANAIRKPDIALHPQQVLSLEKPADFAQWSTQKQNQFFAEKAKASVDKALKATGLGPGNQVRSATDLARADAASMTLGWLRRSADLRGPNAGNLILKTGAGNCGEMALLSKDIIQKSGGIAREWHAGDAHSFTVVGGPIGTASATVDFKEAAWADAWIVDPWAGIACPAAEYTQQLKSTMAKWDEAGWKIRAGANANMSPLDPDWINTLVEKPKKPSSALNEAEPTVHILPKKTTPPVEVFDIPMGVSATLKGDKATLSTQELNECSALAVLSDWDGTIYQSRTLMHLNGSYLEGALKNGDIKKILETLQTSLEKGGKVIFVGGVDMKSPMSFAQVFKQSLHGEQPLLALLKERPGVSVTLAGSTGISVAADGSFELKEGTGRGILPKDMIREIYDLVD